MSFPSDLEIARSVTPRPIMDVARDLGLRDDEIEPYGHTKAKVTLAGDRAARGGAPARQVRRRHGDQPDAARRGQVDDDRRAGPGPQQDRPQGRGLHPPAVARAGIRDQGRRGRRRLQPGHPDGGLQPPPDRRRPRDRGGPQPRRGVPRQPPPPRQRARHRPVRRSSGRGSSTSATAPSGKVIVGLGGKENGDPPRDRVRDHRRVGGHGGPRPGPRHPRPPGAARPDGPRDPQGRHARSPPRTSASPAR